MTAKQRRMDQWHGQMPANPVTQPMAEIHLFLFGNEGINTGPVGLEQRKVFRVA